MLGFGVLEWTFLGLLMVLVGASGVFALFLVAQLFRNPSRHAFRSPPRRRRIST